MNSKSKIWHPFMTVVAIVIINVLNSHAQDWPQFLGPDRNSISPQKGLLRSWPEKGPEVLWSVEVGRGFGGPVVKNGLVYLLDRDDEVGDMMRCLSLQTGEERWRFAYESPGEVPYPGSRSIPIVDDRHVYSVGPNGDLYCVDINTHQMVWKKNVWSDFGGAKVPMWGVAQNPLIYGDLLITAARAPHQAGGGFVAYKVVAYNKTTGNLVWETSSLGNETYSSPTVVKVHGEDHVVFITSQTNQFTNRGAPEIKGNVAGMDPRTGKILWQYSDWGCIISVPCAVDAGNNRLLITGGYDQGTTMIQINKKADGTFETTEIFKTLEFEDQTKPPLLHNGYFYGMFRTNRRNEGLICMNMEGKVMWKTVRNPAFDRGSLILADGLFLATDGMKALYLIEPDPTAFKPVSKVELLEGSLNWAPLALADGKLLIRDQGKMFCLKVAQ
jgi:hypothetical protein